MHLITNISREEAKSFRVRRHQQWAIRSTANGFVNRNPCILKNPSISPPQRAEATSPPKWVKNSTVESSKLSASWGMALDHLHGLSGAKTTTSRSRSTLSPPQSMRRPWKSHPQGRPRSCVQGRTRSSLPHRLLGGNPSWLTSLSCLRSNEHHHPSTDA